MTWDEVAAPGTDPDLLACLVAARYLPRSGPTILHRRAVAATEDGAELPDALAAAAGSPPRTALEAAAEVARRWRRLGVVVACLGDPSYPARLVPGWADARAPLWLARRGEPHQPHRPAVAIVGARRATGYGTGVAAWLAETAATAGVRVVSGGAVGIDAAAHEAAVGSGGGTDVVLGCGHDVAYPRRHAAPGGLFGRILDDGGTVWSELLPDAAPRPAHVRDRNRIVAALADVVVVVEGGARSGSLITATLAADRDVPVMAVPGDVRAGGSVAPHRLLAEGAAPCTGPEDLLEMLGTTAPRAEADTRPTTLPPQLQRVLAARWPRPIRVDDLARDAGVGVGRVLAAITKAQVAGEIAEGPDGIRLCRKPPEQVG